MYAIVSNNNIVKYPVNPWFDNPYTNVPHSFTGGNIANNYYVSVNTTPQPNVNWIYTISEGNPILVNNTWAQNWNINLLPQDELITSLAKKRYNIEVGGTNVANVIYATDRESQTKMTAMAVALSRVANLASFNIQWKVANGSFINLNAKTLSDVITGVETHVQKAFIVEYNYQKIINSGNTSLIKYTDFNSNWPSNT